MSGNDAAPISTGIDALDTDLGDGIPAGSLVGLVAPVASAADQLCAQFAATEHPSVYLTTARPPAAIEAAIEEADTERGFVGEETDSDATVVGAPPVRAGRNLPPLPDAIDDAACPLTVSRPTTDGGATAAPESGTTSVVLDDDRTLTLPTPDETGPVGRALNTAVGYATASAHDQPPVLVVDALSTIYAQAGADHAPRRILNWLYVMTRKLDTATLCLFAAEESAALPPAQQQALRLCDTIMEYEHTSGRVELRLPKVRGFEPDVGEADDLPLVEQLNVERTITGSPSETL